MAEDRPTTITDVAVMRALAHPVRVRLLDHLASTGPSTATECAGVVDLSPSATSYHLRALAKVGMVAEAPGRGDGRERVWRNTVGRYRIDVGPESDPEVRDVRRQLLDTLVGWEEAQVRRYLDMAEAEPADWRAAAFIGNSTLLVTAEELAAVVEAFGELIRPYEKRLRTDPPAGARTVSSLFRAFPTDSPLPD
jgi:DNA-binding transcriptional ArsR family regulator